MHDLGRDEGAYFITMEYVSGEDLKSLIRRIGALPPAKAVAVTRQVCDGLWIIGRTPTRRIRNWPTRGSAWQRSIKEMGTFLRR